MPEHIVGKLRGLEREWWEKVGPLVVPHEDEYSWYAIQSTKANGLGCPRCEKRFQFGDIRIEMPVRTVVVEIEKEGPGIQNLLKYLPLIEGAIGQVQDRPLVLVHIWGKSYPTWKAMYSLLEERLFGMGGERFAGRFQIFRFEEQEGQAAFERIRELLE